MGEKADWITFTTQDNSQLKQTAKKKWFDYVKNKTLKISLNFPWLQLTVIMFEVSEWELHHNHFEWWHEGRSVGSPNGCRDASRWNQFSTGAGLDKTWAPVKRNTTFYSDLHVKSVFKQWWRQQQQQPNSNKIINVVLKGKLAKKKKTTTP